jgi:hypothetical protein
MEVRGYNNYLIDPYGNIYSKNINGILKPFPNKDGYLQVDLSNDGESKRYLIHRLVAEHYIDNPENLPEVDHEDRIKSNNDISNLSWMTHLQNCQNKGIYKNNQLGIKNISYDKSWNGYRYEKKINKVKHKKSFKTLEAAVEYKKEYELKYCKE